MGSPAHWQPAGPFLMQMTPGSLRRAWGLAPSESMGWGQGSTAHTHRTCAHTPLILGPRPASATSTAGAWSRGAARSRRCLAALMGEGNRTGQSSPLPSSLPPGVQSQAAAVPSPLALADNGRFTAGRCCWTTASLWERGGVQPKPQITVSGEARRCPCLTPGAVCVHSLGQ